MAGCVSFLRVSFAAWLCALTLSSLPLANAAETANGDAVSTSGTPGATERARLVYERAAQAYAEKRYRDAIDLFQQADALRPNPAFSFNVGIAYEDMGDSAMALRHYRAYLRKLPQASDRDEVDERIRRLERSLADKGLQQVTILSDPTSAVVSVDGNPVGVAPWTGEIEPGYHSLTLRLAGYEETHRDFDLPPRRAIDVPVTLRRSAPTAEIAAVDMGQESEQHELQLWQHVRPVTWGVLGVAFVSTGAAVGFELARAHFDERARAEPVHADKDALYQRAHRQEVWARGFLMLGMGLGVTAVVLGYQDIVQGLDAPSRSPSLSLGCGGQPECSLGVVGRF